MGGWGIVLLICSLFSVISPTVLSLLCRSQSIERLNFSHSPPPHQHSRVSTSRSDLVVARCDENLHWLLREHVPFERVFLYNKCDSKIEFAVREIPSLQIIAMPNVGSADGAYLRHITTHYSDLAHITTFVKGRQGSG